MLCPEIVPEVEGNGLKLSSQELLWFGEIISAVTGLFFDQGLSRKQFRAFLWRNSAKTRMGVLIGAGFCFIFGKCSSHLGPARPADPEQREPSCLTQSENWNGSINVNIVRSRRRPTGYQWQLSRCFLKFLSKKNHQIHNINNTEGFSHTYPEVINSSGSCLSLNFKPLK